VDKVVAAAEPKSGEIAEVDGENIYVALGSRDGVLEGQLLEVVAKGDVIVVGGEVLGYKETPVGTAEVLRVQNDRLSVARFRGGPGGQTPAAGMTAYVKRVPGTLAMSAFLRPDNAGCQMGQELADKLSAALQGSGRFKLVERSRFEAILQELKLGLNDLFDPQNAAKLGQQVQAKAVVLGTVSRQNDGYSVIARVVEIETGVQVATAEVLCNRSDDLDAKYDGAAGGTGSAVGGGWGGGGKIIETPANVVRLFEALKPFETAGREWAPQPLGTCLVGGSLRDNCIGYPFGYVVFDLRGHTWTELRATVGLHDTDTKWSARFCSRPLTVSCDGRTAFAWEPERDKSVENLHVPLAGVGTLRIDVEGAFLTVSDFELVRQGGTAGAQTGHGTSQYGPK
jgi:hypothetical protein